MKIQCDVCNKDEASVYCVADEAALCDGCDHRVHHANKLARKHQRFSLLQPCPDQYPMCDICQEKKAFLFCQQDRAILCKDCDVPIHKVNEHTKNHDRFLLTGLKLSPTCDIYTASQHHDLVPEFVKPPKFSKPVSVDSPLIVGCDGSTSSISEYLMENIPGWHVEDLLDSSNSTVFNGFSKINENEILPFWDDDLEGNFNTFPTENMGFWVPQAPPAVQPSLVYPKQICFQQEPKETILTKNIKTIRKRRNFDGGFTVPEMTPPSMVSKRSRTLLS
ncbi:hypothetical protein DCAR_0311232 [Daucus carota subsp. sativus]|uniref:B box-type domain-containing protein n=1 Tax=Daucus carota subsp. sativus TaxID=79200 RepID=A0AAF0WNR5_DAUCS|nr:PREDICTED: B-box zinc finger protein 21-like [Daucus carota subsp. sativus]WOG91976.1 hypothetical protein DCAR_0311232 [Daucus carota subsp. sativus]